MACAAIAVNSLALVSIVPLGAPVVTLRPLLVGGDSLPVTPVYPDIARQARVQGIVILECTVGPANASTTAPTAAVGK